tara:strand:+ start:367 stop:1821 length:1455 start_codon:yes stop_codon:yes gene_type:complete
MAKFSGQFLQALAQPSYQQGLFTAAKSLGAMPTRLRQERELANVMSRGQSAIASDNAAELSKVAGDLASMGYSEEAQKFAIASRKAQQKSSRSEVSKELMQAVSGRQPISADLEGRLLDAGFTPQEIISAKTQQREGMKEEGEEALTAMISIEDFDIDKNPQDRKSFFQEASFYKLTAKEARELYDGARSNLRRGSSEASKNITIFNEETNQNEEYIVYRDDQGVVQKTFVGIAERDAEDPRDTGFSTATGLKLVDRAAIDAQASAQKTSGLRQIVQEAEDLAGLPGGALGKARDFLVKDVAGLGDAYSAFRTDLNKLQMQSAIALLPRGPASDKDVALALSASRNLNDYSADERLSILRGMLKIQEAEQRYLEERRAYISRTRDPVAIGYEEYTQAVGAEQQRVAFEQDYSAQVRELKDLIALIPEDEQQAQQYLQVIRKKEKEFIDNGLLPASYMDLLEIEDQAITTWNEVKTNNEIPISLP